MYERFKAGPRVPHSPKPYEACVEDWVKLTQFKKGDTYALYKSDVGTVYVRAPRKGTLPAEGWVRRTEMTKTDRGLSASASDFGTPPTQTRAEYQAAMAAYNRYVESQSTLDDDSWALNQCYAQVELLKSQGIPCAMKHDATHRWVEVYDGAFDRRNPNPDAVRQTAFETDHDAAWYTHAFWLFWGERPYWNVPGGHKDRVEALIAVSLDGDGEQAAYVKIVDGKVEYLLKSYNPGCPDYLERARAFGLDCEWRQSTTRYMSADERGSRMELTVTLHVWSMPGNVVETYVPADARPLSGWAL